MNHTTEHTLYQIMQFVQEQHRLEHPVTSDMIRPYLNRMLAIRMVLKDDYITTVHTPIKKVYYVMSGSFSMIRSSVDGKNTIRIQKAPTFLGVDFTVLSLDGYYADNLALEDCLVLEINQKYFLESIRQNGEMCYEVLYSICNKFFQTSFRYDHTLFYDPCTKLMIYILDHWIANHGQKTKYTIAVPNTRIADEIGVSIRTYYRAVSKLKTDHFISVVSGNICVTYEQIHHIKSYLQNSKAVTALPAFLENSTLI